MAGAVTWGVALNLRRRVELWRTSFRHGRRCDLWEPTQDEREANLRDLLTEGARDDLRGNGVVSELVVQTQSVGERSIGPKKTLDGASRNKATGVCGMAYAVRRREVGIVPCKGFQPQGPWELYPCPPTD